MAYNSDDLQKSLTSWDLTDAQRTAGESSRCYGYEETARASGCPADVLSANAKKHKEALDYYEHRKATLADYLWHAFVGYWIVPAIFLLVVGMIIGGIRRALRRPQKPSHSPNQPTPVTEVKTTTHP